MDCDAIWREASKAASEAAKAKNDSMPPEQSRGLDCGFAWVLIKPARGPMVTYLRKGGIGETRTYGGGGFSIWYSKLHSLPTQSIDVHRAACVAAAEVLKKHGIAAFTGSRLD